MPFIVKTNQLIHIKQSLDLNKTSWFRCYHTKHMFRLFDKTPFIVIFSEEMKEICNEEMKS